MAWESSSTAIRAFVHERDWSQFHSPDNLAKSIAIEAGELLECYQWSPGADHADVRRELADVLIYCLLLVDELGADVDELIAAKIQENERKYPADRARGRSAKYDRL
ncbi:nucleotide pyrophosphohydrolase [Amnibacterium kyonggiense]|uniref:NTP pyrophosphatase (Non-canonical NTP hydrolase) n=1 Tax=Amnibacterium kyonggiense TaxID=595671 RepID=A0A4R7FLJ8_9MICO|nr:nucleotide pyrophosphohydrolase [Amnibacterium kyonggiense]TDS77248.1 NTP pyrophosphatase (non-canonical NTP hydrolase) [Amnibacterium kyonggiense]